MNLSTNSRTIEIIIESIFFYMKVTGYIQYKIEYTTQTLNHSIKEKETLIRKSRTYHE